MKRSRTQRACRVLTRNPRLKCRGIKLSVHSWRAMPIARHNKEINNANIRANICVRNRISALVLLTLSLGSARKKAYKF